ncbi:MAG: GNAT family N-acetyltransferase [Actinobacteria bacterium]|nr:GNAT family N-acetyltransferase [Actinomycetota bacterium]
MRVDQRTRIVHWSPAQMRQRVDEAMSVYESAMAYPVGTGTQRRDHAVAHTSLPGYRASAALTSGDELAGFGYGYRSLPGQWWHDQVRAALGPELAAAWLRDGFELCELHVRPRYQGYGTGRRLLLALAGVVPQPRILLSTPEGPTRAWRLYLDMGFVALARGHHFPGDNRPFGILGAQLPLSVTRPARQA